MCRSGLPIFASAVAFAVMPRFLDYFIFRVASAVALCAYCARSCAVEVQCPPAQLLRFARICAIYACIATVLLF